MGLTENGRSALTHIKQHCLLTSFSAKELSDACGVKIAPATLTGVVNHGYLNRLGGSPVRYEVVDDFLDLMKILEEEESEKGCDNSNLRTAKRVKNDEFYTRYEDIEAEVMKYRKYFYNKVVYLPCDDPAEKRSEFWSFFVNRFDAFGLKKLIATHYDENGKAYKIWIDADTTGDGTIDDGDALQEDLMGNGDFRSPECIAILEECDIVCTNPPFSMFREFLDTILTHNKQFLIIGSKNAYTYKEIFTRIWRNEIWPGYNAVHKFIQPDGSIKSFGNIGWFTNLPTSKREEELILTKTYDPAIHPKYDNYDAINVDRVVDIPMNYDGEMGVPISFIDKYNPNQFELVGGFNGYAHPDYEHGLICGTPTTYQDSKTNKTKTWNGPTVDGQTKYFRILIRHKKF